VHVIDAFVDGFHEGEDGAGRNSLASGALRGRSAAAKAQSESVSAATKTWALENGGGIAGSLRVDERSVLKFIVSVKRTEKGSLLQTSCRFATDRSMFSKGVNRLPAESRRSPIPVAAGCRNLIELRNLAGGEEKSAIAAAPRSPCGFRLTRQQAMLVSTRENIVDDRFDVFGLASPACKRPAG